MAAQLSLARRAEAKLVPSLATGLTKSGDNWEVTTETGERVLGKSVVLAQGTYTAINSILAPLLPPFDLTLTAQTTALLEVNKSNIGLSDIHHLDIHHLRHSSPKTFITPLLNSDVHHLRHSSPKTFCNCG